MTAFSRHTEQASSRLPARARPPTAHPATSRLLSGLEQVAKHMTDRRQWPHISPFLDERAGEFPLQPCAATAAEFNPFFSSTRIRVGASAIPVRDSRLFFFALSSPSSPMNRRRRRRRHRPTTIADCFIVDESEILPRNRRLGWPARRLFFRSDGGVGSTSVYRKRRQKRPLH